jgi:hypothetical protein
VIAIVPFLASLPFLLDDAFGFFKSILFSVTRSPVQGLRAIDLSTYLRLTGINSRLPLLIILFVVYSLAWKYKLPRYLSAFLVMFAFTEFNPVGISQYMAWPMALLPFVMFELVDFQEGRRSGNQSIASGQ